MNGGEHHCSAGVSLLEAVADPVRLQILRALSSVSEATAAELATRSQTSTRTLRRHLEAMITFGVVEEREGESDGETPGRPAARFRLTGGARGESRLQASVLSWTSASASSVPMNGASAR
jgi:predicted ArsR family transcriptional regulator